MTGDNFFKLGQSGENIALNKLKEKLDKKEIESSPTLSRIFSIFDEDKNNVLDKKEIQGIWNTFNLYATSNDNNILDTDEVNDFLNVVDIKNANVTVNDLHEFLKASQESISLSEEQAQNLVVTSLLSDVNHAYMMWHAHSGSNGIVTEGYDKLKNYFDGELGSDNVTEVLALQAEAGEFLMKAKEGNLSKKEYYLENVDHLKKMIKRRLFFKDEATGFSFIDRKRDKLSQKQLEKIVDEYLDKYIAEDLASINLIKKAQMQLTQLTEEGTETFLENFLNNALEHTKENGRTLDNVGVRDKFKLGNSIPIEYNTDEPMEFREVFKLERGREFSKETLEEYFYHQNDAAFKIEAYNSYKSMVFWADIIGTWENIKDSKEQLIQFFNRNFPAEVFAKLKEIINKNKFPISVAKDEAGNITLDLSAYENNPELGKRTLTNICRIALQEKAKILEELMGGNPEDVLLEIQQRSEQLYDTAYGNDFPSALVQAMENDNSTIIQRVTGGISTGGMLMMAAGMLLAIPTGGTSLIGAGGAVAMGGMGAEMALSTAEHFSKDLVTSEEEKAYRDMMIMNTGGLLIGMGAGKASDMIFKDYIDPKLVELFDQAVSSGNRMAFVKTVLKQPEFVGNFLNAATIKVGYDFVISMWGDLALKWGFDTNIEWSDALKANIIGTLIGTGADVGNLAGKLGPKHSIKSIIDSNKPVVEPPKIDVNKVKETIEVKDNQQVDKQPTSRELSLEGEISDKELANVKEMLSITLGADYSYSIQNLSKECALIIKQLNDIGILKNNKWLTERVLCSSPIQVLKIMTALLKKSYLSQYGMNLDYYTLLENTDLQGNILSPVLEYAVNNNYSDCLKFLVDSDGIKANLFKELQEISVLSPELLLNTVSRCYEENFENIKSEYLTIINKFKESPELLKLYEQKHINFRQILNLADYKIAIPIEDRKIENINTEEYQAELKARLENPHNPIKKETLDFALKGAALAQTGRSFRAAISYKPSKLYPIEPLAVVKKDAPSVTLPTAKEAFSTLKKKGKVEINIENTGGLNPTRNEKPIIEAGYESQLGVVEKSGIKIKYGERISWDNARIARDIMQNFYDGNGHTLEGVDISVQRTEDGYYTVKIDGQGHYSHTRLESLGDSSKTDSDDAGNYGEGTRIVAVNLLAKKDTPYVKYACGDWNVKFEKSSDEVSPDMVESLNKNPETLEGNYIEFKTKDLDLVEQVLNSKDYFYHPYNKDFQGFDYENEFFGVKKLNKKEKGNIYVVQRFETDKGMENGLDEFSFVCKTMPKNEELVALNGHKLSLEAGRDRKALTNYEIKEIAKYYLKSMPDKELLGLIASFKDDWILGKEYDKHPNILLEAAIATAISKGIGFEADNTNFVAVKKGDSPVKLDFIRRMHLIPVMEELGDLGISRDMGSVDYIVHEPTKKEAAKIHLIDEATKIISENRDFKSGDQVLPKDAAGATIMCKDGSMLGGGEAILGAGGYLGHWLQPQMLKRSFTRNLMTKLHEITHKFGRDTDEEFSIALLNLQETLFKEFAHNPAVLQKMRVIDALFKNSDNYVKEDVFDVEKFKKDIMKELDVDKTYSPYHEKGLLDKSQENKGYWKDSYGRGMFLEDPNQGSYLQRVANGFIGQSPRYEFVSTDKKFMEFEPFEKKSTALNTTIPTVSEAFRELQTKGAVNIEIPNHGGMKPVNTEKPVILEEDEGKLGVTKKSKIKIRYGAKTNWSDFKIARDIMQNFYDGHGNTLEGVGVNITKNADGSYTVKISGDGNYSYNHLEALGASGKDADGDNAGFFGEGTRIVAVNLLSKLDTSYVKYACGDWEMTFGRNSDNIEVADMTQILTKAETPLKGNIIEFKTTNENLITEILQSKDYFYHPENPDFHDFTFENDEIGIKFLDNPNEKGHLYMVQRYESETPHQDLKGVTIVLKKRPQLADDIGLNTDRDRLRLKHEFIKNVASKLASSKMSNEDYIKLLATFKDYYAVDKDNIEKVMWNYPENKKPLEEHFAAGLIKAAANKGIKIDYKKEKLAYVEGNDDFAIKYLAEQGYRFVPLEMSDLGIPSAKQIYENEHPLHSIEPTKAENKKLDILCEAIALLGTKNASTDINRPDFYMFNGKDCNAGEVEASKKSGSPKVFLDRDFLRNADFYNCISKIIGENLELKHNSKEPSSYSYDLTDLMAEEINMFLQDYTLAPKLKALKEIFDSIQE